MKDNRLPYLALSCVGLIASGPAFATPGGDAVVPESDVAQTSAVGAVAVTQSSTGQPQDRPDIVVNGDLITPPQVESPRATAELLDTPQTVTVISDQVLRRQNLLTLRDALSTIPGITFGAGEGGGGYGDAINLRGYSGSNDITQDGVRDSAQYSRTDPFNLQQIEIYNGANSVFNGSGSIGGTINLVSKVPQADDLTIISAAGGTDNYLRGTIDSNWRLNDLIAVRVNAMGHRNDYPGRDVENYRRWGIAPSITIGIGSPTSLTLAYVHQEDDNTPIYGVPFFRGQVNDGPLPGVDDSDYYGIVNLDQQRVTVDRLTATFRHQFSDDVQIRNLTRWQRVGQDTVTSAPQGTFCLGTTGRQPVATRFDSTTGLACTGGLTAGIINLAGPRALIRDQENQLFINQTDLRIRSDWGNGIRNTLVVGGSVSVEDYEITSGNLNRTAAGVAVALPNLPLTNPDTTYTGPINRTVTARSQSTTENQAIYAFDTLELGIVELNAAVRYEWNNATFQAIDLGVYPPGTTPLTALQLLPQTSNEALFSYRLGAVVKPTPDLTIYAAYGNSRTPSSATVRLGCGVPTQNGGPNPCDTAPERGVIYEAGLKWALMNRRLELTASIFRNERSAYRIPSNDPLLPAAQVTDGRARVDGIALGITGNITPQWSIFANYTYLDSEVLQSVSDFCLATPSPACLNTTVGSPALTAGAIGAVTINDPQAGDELVQTPRHAGSLFTTYSFPFGLQVGYGVTYQGDFALNQRTLLGRTQYRSDAYTTQRLFVSYELREGLTVQLNVQNLFDEDYYTNIRNNIGTSLGTLTNNVLSGFNNGVITGGWAMPGEGRQAVLSVYYSF